MKNELNNLKNEALKIRMTPEEKAAMKARIFGAPAAYIATQSPYFFFNYQFLVRGMATLLIAVVVLGGSTAYAAEGTLPGDALYTFKINVSERVQTAFAVTAESKAATHLALAQKRVEEAEALAAEGSLDASATAELETNFEQHANQAEEFALEIARKDPGAAVAVRAKLASSLGVHGEILAAVGEESEKEEVRTNTRILSTRVLARAETNALPAGFAAESANTARSSKGAGTARTQSMTFSAAPAADTATSSADASLVATAPAPAEPAPTQQNNDDKREASRTQERAADALKDARDSYKDSRPLDGEAKNQVEAQFVLANEHMSEGSTQMQTGAYTEAQASFTEAMRISLKLEAVLEAQRKYRRDIITPLLNVQIDLRGED